jgi:hypothetical protein
LLLLREIQKESLLRGRWRVPCTLREWFIEKESLGDESQVTKHLNGFAYSKYIYKLIKNNNTSRHVVLYIAGLWVVVTRFWELFYTKRKQHLSQKTIKIYNDTKSLRVHLGSRENLLNWSMMRRVREREREWALDARSPRRLFAIHVWFHK